MIGRIDQLQKSLIDDLESAASKYENAATKGNSELKEWRTIGVSALVAVLTIFLTFNSTYPMELWTSFIISFSLIVAIVVYFIILTKIIGIMGGLLNDINSIIQEGTTEMSHSYGFFLSRVADLEQIDYAYIKNYFYFVMLLYSAVMAYMANEFRELSKNYEKFHDFKDLLMMEVKGCEENLTYVPLYYERFDSTKVVSQRSLEFMTLNLKDHLLKK